MKVGRYHQGTYNPHYPEKYVGKIADIRYRSQWELKFMRWCDLNPSVLQWNSEGIKIPYWSQADQKQRTYHVDFIVKYRTPEGGTKTSLIEIKPDAQTRKPTMRGRKKQETYLAEMHTYQVNQDKWAHARAYAEKNGMDFIIMTEYDLGLAPGRKPK